MVVKKYMSTATFDEIMDQLQGSTGKACIKDLSVLYLDVVNFTGFSESHSPEETAKMLNDLFGICEVITKECHGDIDKFIGDVVNTAARIESVTDAMCMSISEATYSRLKDRKAFMSHKEVKVKNRKEPLSIFKYALNSPH